MKFHSQKPIPISSYVFNANNFLETIVKEKIIYHIPYNFTDIHLSKD